MKLMGFVDVKLLGFAVLLLILAQSQPKRIPSFAGDYRALVTSITNASEDYDSLGIMWAGIRTTQARGRQLQYGWGHVYQADYIPDDMKVEVRMASRSNNQWKNNAFVFKFDRACSNAKVHAPALTRLLVGDNINGPCPFKPQGLREAKNHSFEFTFPHFRVMPFGRYQFTLAMFKGSQTVGVGVAECDIVPRV